MGKRKYKQMLLFFCICVLVILAACGGSAEEVEESNNNEENSDTEEASSDFPRTFNGVDGEVTIDSKPERIAIVDWRLYSTMFLFDVDSLAIVMPFTYEQSELHNDTYQPYVNQIDDLVIVGENTMVDLEMLVEYEPDVIVTGSVMNEDIWDQLNAIAPTVVIEETEYDESLRADWGPLMRDLGEIIGQGTYAEKYIQEFDEKVEDAREIVEATDGNVAFVQVREKAVYFHEPDELTLFYKRLGLEGSIEGPEAENGELSLEGLSEMNPDHLFLGYFNYEDEDIPALIDEWEKTQVWQQLNAVQNKQIYPIDGQMAFGMGPINAQYGIDAIVEALE